MQLEVDSIVEGKVTRITGFGVFVQLPTGQTGMVHISEVAQTYVKEIRDFVTENQTVKVKILSIGEDGKISLSMKKAVPAAPRTPVRAASSPGRPGDYEWRPSVQQNASFEDMLNKFKQTSDEKILDLKRSVDGKHGGFARRGPSGGRQS
ncbi:MAG: S1 RNA-binding domain-containing protein [Clostridia bacterium]|nr:S1 RNA-binding domain-containing protein [Clostridia bacterium]